MMLNEPQRLSICNGVGSHALPEITRIRLIAVLSETDTGT